MKEQEANIIKTQDENGEVHTFELVDIINVDEQDYGLLLYIDDEDEEESDDEEEELVIMRLSQEGEAYSFEMIENDEEFQKVIKALEDEAEEE